MPIAPIAPIAPIWYIIGFIIMGLIACGIIIGDPIMFMFMTGLIGYGMTVLNGGGVGMPGMKGTPPGIPFDACGVVGEGILPRPLWPWPIRFFFQASKAATCSGVAVARLGMAPVAFTVLPPRPPSPIGGGDGVGDGCMILLPPVRGDKMVLSESGRRGRGGRFPEELAFATLGLSCWT